MYNPTLAQGRNRRRPMPNPHAGTKHSDIVRRSGVGSHAPVSGTKSKTGNGYSTPVFVTSNFSQRYEVLYAGNAVGFGVNMQSDRTILVRQGVMFITTENSNGNRIIDKIPAGGNFNAPAGTKYGYATSGTSDLELTITEDTNYASGWESLSADVIKENDAHIAPSGAAIPTRRRGTKAVAQASSIAIEKNKKPQKKSIPARLNPNAAAKIGVSPRPLGAEAIAGDD